MTFALEKLRALLDDVEWQPAEREVIDAALAEIRTARERAKPAVQTLFGVHHAPPADEVALHFVIPTPPAAKNSRNVFRTGKPCRLCQKRSGPLVSSMSADAEKAVQEIQAKAVAALRVQAPHAFEERRPLFVDDDVRIELVHNVHADTCDVLIKRAGPCPKGVTGRRRDVINVPELVADAVQRIAFTNDRQVVDLRVWRNLGAATHGPDW